MSTARKLPARPNLKHLKKQAKDRLKAMRATNRAAKLAHAQLDIAHEYGFASWRALHAHIEGALAPKSQPVPPARASELVRQMQRAWAESIAIIEQRVTSGPRWIPLSRQSPFLTEKQADAFIIPRGIEASYRMTSVWYDAGAPPVRAIEIFDDGDNTRSESGWRAIDWKPSNPNPTWKPARSDDLGEAIDEVRRRAPASDLRVVTIRRMLRARRDRDGLKVIKKHYIGTHPLVIEPATQSTGAPRSRKPLEWQPLMDASFIGNAVLVESLLARGADPNILSTTAHRYRPLHRAIEHKKTMPKHEGHDKTVKLLLQHGADPRLRATPLMLTALQLAATQEPRFVPLLKQYPFACDVFHAAVLLFPVRSLLRADPALPTARDENGWTALHYCAASAMFHVDVKAAKDQLEVARLLLDAGADPNATHSFDGKWPISVLYYCCGWHNNPALTELLIKAGANPCDGEAVYHASDEGHDDCLALFGKYVDPKKLADESTKSLNIQLHWRRTRGMKWLLEHGADPTWRHPERKKTAIDEAQSQGKNAKVIAMLKQYAPKR